MRPRSLAGQLALLIAGALLVAQGINFALLLAERRERAFNQSVEPAIARLVDVAERAAAGEWAGDTPPFRPVRRVLLARAPRTPPNAKADPAATMRLRAALADSGVPARGSALRVGRPQRDILLLQVALPDGRWLIARAPLPGIGPDLLGRLLAQTGLIFLLLLGAVLWIGRRAARPLADLTTAADAMGARGIPPAVPERGPDDIRRLVRAFNAGGARIGAMLAEKDQMLGAIGHDLRTPLASLRLRLEGIADPDERARAAQTAEEMERTLDDILSLARLGREGEPATPHDLSALAEAVTEDVADLGAPVRFEPSPPLAARLRPAPIRRALRNLIDNAAKHGGSATVRVRREGARALVEVDDDGPGIPDAEIGRMFEAFARLEGSRSRATGGTGLGLTLARAVAREGGGDVTLANRPKGGLRATLSLPP